MNIAFSVWFAFLLVASLKTSAGLELLNLLKENIRADLVDKENLEHRIHKYD